MSRTLLTKACLTEIIAKAAEGGPSAFAATAAEGAAPAGEAGGPIDPAATIDWSNEQWLLRTFRAGTAIVLAFQVAYLAADWLWSGAPHGAILPWHLFNIVISLMFLGITYSPGYQRHMAQMILVSCTLLFWSSAALAIIARNSDLLTFTLTITMVGAAAMVPWNWRWQGGLAIASVAALAAFTAMGGWANPHLENDWIALTAAIGVAHYAALAGERYRREIASRIMALQSSGRELIGEIAQREAAVPAIGAVNRRLRESEAKLRKIFANTTDIITINRLSDSRYMDFNQSFERLGYARAEVLAQSAESLGIWTKPGQLRDFMEQIKKTGAVANFDHETRAKDGTVYQYQVSATIVELGGRSAWSRSITISRLGDGRYIDLNEGFTTASGYTREEILKHTAASLEIWDDRTKLQRFLREIKKSGTVANFELRMRTKSGSVSLFLVSATIMELDGELCVVAIGKDITTLKQVERDLITARELMRAQIETLERTEERLRAEIVERSRAMKQREEAVRELADSEGKLRRIFEVTPDSMSIARISDGRIIAVNESLCAMSGLKREELVGRIAEETGIWCDGLKNFGQALRVNGSVKDFEANLRHKSGRVIPHIVSAVVAELGGELCVISVAHDITDRKRVETELMAARGAALAASLAKSEFLSAMSHEIRTPMNAILGMADMLWESELDAEQRRYLATMRSNSNTLLDLINEILDLAKVESGRLDLEQIPIDLLDLIEKLLETLAVRAQSKGLELIGRIVPGTLTALRGDPLRLRQILFNLVGNAIKFTHAGEIELTLERSGPPLGYTVTDAATRNGIAPARVNGDAGAWMRFTVRDTGIGISAMQARSIFSSFTQADSSMARKYGGSGLGLTIVKRLVDLMGGAIAVESTPGSGSSFTVTVPLERGR